LAGGANSPLTLVAGNNVTLTTNTVTNSVTINSSGSGGSSSDNVARATANAAFNEANSAYSLASSASSTASDAYSAACTAYSIAITDFNAFTDTHGNTISGSTSQSVQFVAGNNITVFANPTTSQITISSTSSGSGNGFPYLDLGYVSTSVDPLSGTLDLGSLS